MKILRLTLKTAALFGKLHPLGAIPASFFFGSLLVGADKMQRAVQVPSALVDTILGLVVLFVVGSSLLSRRWAIRRCSWASCTACRSSGRCT